MSKPLVGKRYFEALGRSAKSHGQPLHWQRRERQPWPMWARTAWARGWLFQQSGKESTAAIIASFDEEAARKGIPLQQCVEQFIGEPS